MKTFGLVFLTLTFLLSIFTSVLCSRPSKAKEKLRKKLQDARDFPQLELLTSAHSETLEGLSEEFKTLIFKTLSEVNDLLKFIKTRPLLALKHSGDSENKNALHNLAIFFFGLRFLQSSLSIVTQYIYPELSDPEYIIDRNIVENGMGLILPSIRYIQNYLPLFLQACILFYGKINTSEDTYSLSNVSLLQSVNEHTVLSGKIKNALTSISSDLYLKFIRVNSLMIYDRINRLNMIICLYNLHILNQTHLGVTQLVIENRSPMANLILPFQFLTLFITQSGTENSKLLSADSLAAFHMIESLVQIAEENSQIPFLDRLHSPVLLSALTRVKNIPQKCIDEARARLAVLEKIRADDQIILLSSSVGRKPKKQNFPAIAKPKRNNQKAKTKEKNRKQKQVRPDKRLIDRHRNTQDHRESDMNVDVEEDETVEPPLKLINNSITLPVEIHFIRFGQYCFDNVLKEVLEMIPNNENYTWTMVADYCTTEEGQDLLHKLGLNHRDLNDCIQVVRRRAEVAHPKELPLEQILKDISTLLAFHRNFKPLEHLFTYINSISEWKKVPGSGLPAIDNDETEILSTPDILALAVIRVGQYCLDKILFPAATAIGLDSTQVSMTEIVQEAENHSVIVMPDGSSLQIKLLVDCRTIYQLRNSYAHQFVTKEQAIASEQVAFGGIYSKMSVLNEDYVCKKVNGQFY